MGGRASIMWASDGRTLPRDDDSDCREELERWDSDCREEPEWWDSDCRVALDEAREGWLERCDSDCRELELE